MGELFDALLGGAGWGLGLGAAVGVVSLAGKGLRPVAKEAIKLGMTAGARVQEWTAEMREQADDLVAEARAEQGGEAGSAPADTTLVTPGGEPAATTARRRTTDSAATAPVAQP